MTSMDQSKKRALSLSSSPGPDVTLGGRSLISPDAECSTPVASKSSTLEPRMEMAFIGRYRDKWKNDSRWRSQLMHRKSFSTFLAFVCLDEHHAHQRRKGWVQPAPSSPVADLLGERVKN
eukprot:Protomagalhaensia_sp_Gyna_25__4105@NODE_371_length_3667_cov_108_092613_g285_i0_p3_GENE_NODE_371_length_3667_cov_108_092613_g285_i0NODE_371_length_3667_cov_108_092613_g285_i0_p3_ORF_typecomplete_len120_score16_62_NODE_371_length_3667_cov_108_092613_g285_i018992258